jgi:hypothetical protein
MVIDYSLDDASYDRLMTGNKGCITTRHQLGEIGDTLMVRDRAFRIVDIWKSTHGFARGKLYRIEGMVSPVEYDVVMANLYGIVHEHHWFYTHFIAPVLHGETTE